MKLRTINPKIVKINILNPEANIIVIHDAINNKACPRSGWLINKITIKERTIN